ncbi:MAG: riboflavin biosynthesis protein RibF [Dehalococcoidia bacterium]|jgi:riboflavin kinase/FMN adenylyltransferase|nr:riboflavin biosynthesis protein RibF [Dehalococcoidia bacterium]
MNLRHQLASAAPDQDTVLTLGVFDGVHLGHQHLLRQLIQMAGSSCVPGVLTFSNHPSTILRPGTHPGYLNTPEEKIRLIKEQGVDLVVSLEFTWELAQVSAWDFSAMLVEMLRTKGLVLGPDAALGHNREGTVDYLRRRGDELGFWVETVRPLVLDGADVKSSRIRNAVVQGDMAVCTRLMRRKFSTNGRVVVGDHRGKQLGFPTANLEIASGMMVPGDGIYATWAIIDGVRHLSATSIGVRPTFGLTERLAEVYVIDFDDDLYGQDMRVEFVRKLRDQQTFPGVEALVDQINRDVADSRLALAEDRGTHVA